MPRLYWGTNSLPSPKTLCAGMLNWPSEFMVTMLFISKNAFTTLQKVTNGTEHVLRVVPPQPKS